MQYPSQINKTVNFFMQMNIVLIMSALLVSCAHAPWEEPRGKTDPLEDNIQEIEALIKEKPESTKLRQELYLTKEAVTQELMLLAEKAKLENDFLAAQVYYERILAYSPKDSAALSAIKKLSAASKGQKRLEKATQLKNNNQLQLAKKLVHESMLEAPHNTAAKQLNGDIDKQLKSKTSEPPKLKVSSNKPVTLELRDADIKVVFEALSRATGINFILDKDIRQGTKASVFVRKMPIEDAINLVLSSNGLQKKNLSENTALIFPATTEKLEDYRDLMIRSFYLTNTTAKQAAEMLKSVLRVDNLFIDERINMVVIRDTPEVVRIAEKLIKANDIEVAEVVLDIEVLEVTRSRLQEIGVNYPTSLTAVGTTVEALKSISSSGINVTGSPALNFRKTTGDVNLLSNPRIRVKNNEQAKVVVGERIPIFTTVNTANVGTSDTVTYTNVGLTLDVEPRITLDNFVNIKVGLEVSSLGDQETGGNGTTAFRIGTRSANTVLRLKDGETQVLAGLIQDDERTNTNRLPGLGDFPLLGRLFSNQEDRKTKTEIVLAITPRIVGNLRLPDAEISEYWSGTETLITDKPAVGVPPSSSNGLRGSLSTRQRASERLRQQRRQRNQSSKTIPGETPKLVPKSTNQGSSTNTNSNSANGSITTGGGVGAGSRNSNTPRPGTTTQPYQVSPGQEIRF